MSFTDTLRALVLSAAAAGLVAGCGSEPPPSPPPVAERTPPTPGPAGPANLDAFGNLKAAAERVMGFHLPMGTERRGAARVVAGMYIDTTEARLTRFYRSRGYTLTRTLTALEVSHAERTLATLPESDAKRFANAVIRVEQGPGPGYTLRFDSGEVALVQPPLLQLVEAERQAAGIAPPTATVGGDDAEAKDDAPAPSKTTAYVPTTPKRLEQHELSRLRKSAFERQVDPKRARDVSDRVYEWQKANPGRAFID